MTVPDDGSDGDAALHGHHLGPHHPGHHDLDHADLERVEHVVHDAAEDIEHDEAELAHPSVGARAMELFGLTGLAIAQPVLDTMGANPLEFVSRRAGPLEVIVFALVVLLFPTILLLGIEVLVERFVPKALARVHAALLGFLIGLVVLGLVRSVLGPRGAVVLVVAVGAAVGFAMAVLRWGGVRRWLHYLAPFPLVFLAAFLVTSPVSTLVFEGVPPVAADIDVPDLPPIVMIVFDELPQRSLLDQQGEIDAEVFPNFARLASNSTWYPDLTAASSWTNYAVPAMVSGEYPDTNRSAVSTDHPENLFTLLADTYTMNVWEGTTQLCPPNLCAEQLDPLPSPQRIGDLIKAGSRSFVLRSWPFEVTTEALFADGVAASLPPPEIFERFRGSVAGQPRSTLHYLHLPYPHSPWKFMPSGAEHDADFLPWGLGGTELTWDSELAARAAEQGHHLQLRDADRELGLTLDALERQGIFDEALIVVASDHGIAFEANEPYRAANPTTMASVGYPLLMIKAPGQRDGVIDTTPHQSVDILPLMMDALGITIPWSTDGSPAGNPDGGRRYYPAFLDDLPDDQGGWVDPGAYPRPTAGSGTTAEPARSATLGAYPELYGTQVDDVAAGEPVTVGASWVSGAQRITSPRPDGRLPATIELRLDGGIDGEVVVAVDGVVALSGPVSTDAEGTHFYGLLPEAMLTPGGHDLEVFVVTGPPDAPVLHPVALR